MIDYLFAQIFSFLSLIFIIILGYIVLKRSRSLISRLFFLLTIILDVWIFGTIMMFNADRAEQIIFWDRIIYVGIVFWPALQYHFSLAITKTSIYRKILLGLGYLLSVLFLFASQTNYFLNDVFYYAWGAHTKAQFFHHFFVVFFVFYSLIFFISLIQKYKDEQSALEKKRLLYYILGFASLNLLGITGFLPAYEVSVYPVFLAAPLLFSVVITYAIVYFGLMNIKVIMRSYSVYIASLVSVFLPSYLAIYLVYKFYPQLIFIVFSIAFVLALLAFPKLKKYYYRVSNKYFFSGLYDFDDLIYKINNRLHSTLDIKKMFKALITLLQGNMHVQAIAALSYNYETKSWSSDYNSNFKKINIKKLKYSQSLEKLVSKNTLLVRNDFLESSLVKNCEACQYLYNLGTELFILIKIRQVKKITILVFNKKESGEAYNNKDLKLLSLVGIEVRVALENILLYENVRKFNLKLKKEIKKATVKLEEQNKDLKKLDKLKDEFISIVSHQLRTPLTSIRWFTGIILNDKKNKLNKRQSQMLKQVEENNLSMIKLVDDLLDVSHIDTGRKFNINKENFKLDKIINSVISENSYLINKKNIKIINRLSPDREVMADEGKFKQIWQNLIGNAIKYSPDNTTVILYEELKAKKIFFYVKDQGIGIPKEERKKLFNKFFRAKNAASEHVDGTGLGLYIAREIARAHSGDLKFKPDKNKGSIFYFYLPKDNIKSYKIKKSKKMVKL
ncbi:MAG: hypothetical protein K9M44_00020 [Candidatus Pacebacteria bacterium]|nr:hypothetical protein [Candidatus Paceibacterota bacterium]